MQMSPMEEMNADWNRLSTAKTDKWAAKRPGRSQRPGR
jgi:hypothetical protein